MSKQKIQDRFRAQILKTLVLLLVIGFLDLFFNFAICDYVYAQDPARVESLKQQVIKAPTIEDSYNAFEEITDIYFAGNKYNEFIGFLGGLAKEKKELQQLTDYFTALCRYYQLKYLEETQNWDEYFANSNTYREEIVSKANAVVGATTSESPLNLYARLVLWKFHKEQNDAFYEEALEGLLNSTMEYSKGKASEAIYIKAVADELAFYGEKGKSRQLYKIYTERILSSEVDAQELKKLAADFYREGNLELAQLVYDAYIERITPLSKVEELTPILFEIADSFTYDDARANDPFYAEKIFQKIEEVSGRDIFNEEQIYMRALNLEKAKAYAEAKDIYLLLLSRFPESAHKDEAIYKIGLVYTYILRDLKNGRDYFKKLAEENTLSPQVVSALYQLGLLSQWQGDNDRAKQYYSVAIDKAKADFSDTVALARERLQELEQARPMEYGLKVFLDASLAKDGPAFDMTKLDLRASPSKAGQNQQINIKSTPYTAESGCMQVELQYLWSGDLGSDKPDSAAGSFLTQYPAPGTKFISLVATSPSEIIDRSIEIIDIQ